VVGRILYEVTARAIKTRWPDLKVGGPSLGYTGEFKGGQFQAGEFLLRFLRHCRDHPLPLDFFSWHRYAQDPSDYARLARAIRQLLDEHGFTKTESHLNEWNYLPNEDWRPMMKEGQGLLREQWSAEIGSPNGAAFAAWTLISLQDAPRRVQTVPCETGRVAVCAGLNSESTRAAILISNFNTAGAGPDIVVRALPWNVTAAFELYLVDANCDFRLARRGSLGADGRLALAELKAPAVAWLKLAPLPAESH